MPSSNDVRYELVLQHGDLVLEAQLPFLEAGELELVRSGHRPERLDGGVQIAMLEPKADQLRGCGDIRTVRHATPQRALLTRNETRYN